MYVAREEGSRGVGFATQVGFPHTFSSSFRMFPSTTGTFGLQIFYAIAPSKPPVEYAGPSVLVCPDLFLLLYFPVSLSFPSFGVGSYEDDPGHSSCPHLFFLSSLSIS